MREGDGMIEIFSKIRQENTKKDLDKKKNSKAMWLSMNIDDLSLKQVFEENWFLVQISRTKNGRANQSTEA